jgi:hypothetical protein
MIDGLRPFLANFKDMRTSFEPGTLLEHLDVAAEWLLAAQSSTPDDGISHSYDVRIQGWHPSYPETTGYAIETLYDYARLRDKPEFYTAATRAADWEIAVQMPDGAVIAGMISAQPPKPTIFNTGQVLFGWAAAIENVPDNAKYRTALRRASDWLVAAMDEDGAWRRFPSPFGPPKESAYNTRSAFGLARAAEVLGAPGYLEAAVRNVRYVERLAHPNGFLPDNCLQDPRHPLVHTIAYSIRGLLEVGMAADLPEIIDLALRMARGVAGAQRNDGGIPGRLDSDWTAAAKWVCVTGNCQMALNWFRFHELGVSDEFTTHAVAANRFVMRIHDRKHSNPGIRGGVKGSHPIGGGYMSFRYPNWAAKFFMDALMLELKHV